MKYILCILSVSVLVICFSGQEVKGESIARIHIVANSDSEKDIEIKMKVKDAVAEFLGQRKLEGDIKEELELLSDKIEERAKEVLISEGVDYSLSVEVGVKHFDRKTLGYSSFPAGDYTALTVTLGKGEGHNWWSVIFPELSLSASFLTGEEGNKGKTVIIGGDTVLRVRCFLYDFIKTYTERAVSPYEP